MATERTYTIPLRKEWLRTGHYRRTKRAVNAIRSFLVKHMKAEPENVKLGRHLNLEMWKHGIKNPPGKIKVNVTKDDKGIVKAELFGAPKETPKVEKAPAKKPAAPAAPAKTEAKPAQAPAAKPEAKPAEKKPEVKPAAKPVEKPTAPAEKKIIQ